MTGAVLPPAATQSWFAANWDKLFTFFASIILSGVIGFFAAVFSVRTEIADLRDRVSKTEAQVNSTLLPKMGVVENHDRSIVNVLDRLSEMSKQNDLSVQTNKLLDLRIEQERQLLVKELREFLADINKKK